MKRKPTPEEYRIARERGISNDILYKRMTRGWDFDRSINTKLRSHKRKNYSRQMSVYKGEEEIAFGTVDEISEILNVKKETVLFYATPSNLKRIEARNSKNARIAFWLDDDDED